VIVTVASLRLRSLFGFFPLAYTALGIVKQIRESKGFIRMRNTGFGYLHHTISMWEAEADSRAFAHSGAHAEAMRKAAKLAEEIRVLTYAAETAPAWAEAKRRVAAEGRVYAYPSR
jgi:hypothetical protein